MSNTTTQTDELYFLARNVSEAKRLEHQHRILMQGQGYYIHPDIEISTTARVAELATGSGIWLRELGQLNPDYKCHGFDISDSLFPSDMSSQNVSLHTHDVKQSFDPRWHNYFDFVHIRFLVPAMSVQDWAITLRNALQLLKPKGWLQWCENDTYVASRYAARGPPQNVLDRFPYTASDASGAPYKPPRVSALQQLVGGLIPHSRGEGMMFAFLRLEDLFRDKSGYGLDNVTVDAFNTDGDPSLRKEFTMMAISGARSIAERLRSRNGPFADFEAWRAQAMSEVDQGAYICLRVVNFVGQKTTA